MDTTINIDELRKRKIFVATPMFGGMCTGMYTKSTADLATLCTSYGVTVQFFYLFNESLIPRARNYLVDEFLRSKDFTHLMFIDGDISFNAEDVLHLAVLCDPYKSDYDIICGPYPKKTIAWEKIKTAVDKGMADIDPEELNRYVGDYVFNPAHDDQPEVRLDEPVEVLEGGTGFMMISRETLERYRDAYPEFMYRPDHVRTEAFDGTREIMAFFDCVIDNKQAALPSKIRELAEKGKEPTKKELLALIDDTGQEDFSKRYLSEDYMFCQWARKAGIKVWLCPWMKMIHTGTYNFGGSLVDIAQIGESATVNPDKLKAQKQARKRGKRKTL